MNKKKIYALSNLLVVIALIVWNYVANAMGIDGNTVGSLSDEYANLFTPAGYAFSIWGLIFLGLLANAIFQVKRAFDDKQDDSFVEQIGPWLIIANLANCAWVWFWLTEQTGVTVILMLIILLSLVTIIIRLNMERWDAPLPIIFFVWWPICLYSGWIAVATIANISAYLAKLDWLPFFSEVTWTIIMIVVALLLNLFMIATRNMREFAGVGAWALIAIAVRHWGEYPSIQWAALVSAIILVIAMSLHAYRNRKTSPLAKIMG